jgi:ABC-type spermidine/putrescine transport system permease subunit II
MDPLTDHNSFDALAVVVAISAIAAVLAVAAAATAAIGIREFDAVGRCLRSESSIDGDVLPVSPLLNAILLLTLYNQLWEIFSTFLFLVDDTDK